MQNCKKCNRKTKKNLTHLSALCACFNPKTLRIYQFFGFLKGGVEVGLKRSLFLIVKTSAHKSVLGAASSFFIFFLMAPLSGEADIKFDFF